jgi:hypothetical protein
MQSAREDKSPELHIWRIKEGYGDSARGIQLICFIICRPMSPPFFFFFNCTFHRLREA